MASQFAVDLIFSTKGGGKLRDLSNKLQGIERGGKGAQGGIDGVGRSARTAESRVKGLVGAVGKLALAYGTLRAGQAALQAGIRNVESERRIKFLAEGYGEAAQLADAASRAAQKFGVSQTEANQALANTYARLRPVGIELETIQSVYGGFSTAARLSGASATEASAAFTQLAQALGSGALRGDEFNSIAEQVPGILTAISKETGIAQGELRDYAAQGKLTAAIVIRALKRIETEGADQLSEALNGPAQKIKDFQNATEKVQIALTKTIIPEMSTAFENLAEVILALEGPIKFIGQLLANTLGTALDLINLVTKPGQFASRKAIEGGRLPLDSGAAIFGVGPTADLFKGTGPGGGGLKELTRQARELSKLRNQPYEQVLTQLMQDRLKTMDAAMQGAIVKADQKTPPKPTPTPDKEKKSGGKSGKSAADIAKEQLKAYTELSREFSRQVQLLRASSELERQLLQIGFDKQDRQLQISELKSAEQQTAAQLLSDELARLQVANAQVEAYYAQADAAGALTTKLKEGAGAFRTDIDLDPSKKLGKIQEFLQKSNEWINDTDARIVDLAGSMEGQLAGAFTSIIDGSKSTQEAFSDMFKGIAASFLQMATQMIAKMLVMAALNALTGGILGGASKGVPGAAGLGTKAFSGPGIGSSGFGFGNILGFAKGGRPPVGKVSVVGEKGPELFVPSGSGTIVPNHQLGGGGEQVVHITQTINVSSDGSSSSTQSDTRKGEELGRQMTSVVKAVLMHERRPGGLLAR